MSIKVKDIKAGTVLAEGVVAEVRVSTEAVRRNGKIRNLDYYTLVLESGEEFRSLGPGRSFELA